MVFYLYRSCYKMNVLQAKIMCKFLSHMSGVLNNDVEVVDHELYHEIE